MENQQVFDSRSEMPGGAPFGAPPALVFLLGACWYLHGCTDWRPRPFFIADSGEGDRRMTRRNSALTRHSSHRNKTPLFLTAIFSGALCAHAATTVVTNQTDQERRHARSTRIATIISFVLITILLAFPFLFHTNMTSDQLAFCGPCQCYKCKGWLK